jgi:hypothetical protein
VEPDFFPLDERLCLLPSQFSPFLVQCLVRLGTIMPFEQVPALLVFLTGVHVSIDTVRRVTEQAGAAHVALEDRDLARLERELPAVPAGPARQQISADGAMVPLVHGEWAEVRTTAIGTLATQEAADAIHAQEITYFSRLCTAHDFIRQTALPLHERGIAQAETVVAVVDGAEWLQEWIDAHCPNAIRILDFPHAVEYLSRAAQAAFGSGTREASVWLDTWAPILKTGDPDTVLAAIRALPMWDDEACAVRDKVLGYLTKRRSQIAYASFQRQGYPIGSGMIESANKLVVEARLKGSGMHWERRNVSPMLALRAIACSGTWEQAWPRIWAELRRQDAERHRQRRLTRHAAQEQHRPEAATSEPAPSPSRPKPSPTVVNGRPTADHVWRTHPYDPILLAKASAKL